jgi:hypothetical protein
LALCDLYTGCWTATSSSIRFGLASSTVAEEEFLGGVLLLIRTHESKPAPWHGAQLTGLWREKPPEDSYKPILDAESIQRQVVDRAQV